jgi:uncharacterized damage-inducible protein DinB
MRHIIVTTACVSLCAAAALLGAGQAAQAPAPPANLIEEVQRMYTPIHNNILAAAEQFPEDKYTWQPTPDVRSWARLIGHITDDNTGACWSLAGAAARPAVVDAPNSAESAANKKTKADLVAGLRASVDMCAKAFSAVTPANMNEPSGSGTRSKLGLLIYNTSHTNEHYGNLVTYMRLQNMVPPSSQPRGGGPGRGRGN